MVRIWSSWRRPGAAHLHPATLLLRRREVLLGRLVRRLGIDPQDELVEGQPRDRRQVLPVERHAGVERRREQIGQRDDDGVGVTLLALDVQEALRPGAARLVDDDERFGRKLVLLGDARDEPRHLVGATARPRRDHELDGLGRLPRHRRLSHRQDDQRNEHAREPSPEPSPETSPLTLHAVVLPVSGLVEGWCQKTRARPRSAGLALAARANDYFPAFSFQKGITPGISHLSHISSTFAWK